MATPNDRMEIGFEDHRIEERLLFPDFATEGHDAHIRDGTKLVGGSGFDIDEIVLVAMVYLFVEGDIQIAFEHIESLLHIGMDMGKRHLSRTKVGDSNLGQSASRLITTQQYALLAYCMRGDDGEDILETFLHSKSNESTCRSM